MKVLSAIVASALLLACSAVKEESFGRLKSKNGPIVTLFYNQDTDNLAQAESIMIEAEKRMARFDFYKCDTKARGNARAAKQANLQSDIHVFVRTREDGIEEFRMPLTLANLLRYLRLRGVAGDPANVQQFKSTDAVQQLVDSTHMPVFVKFFEPWCAHCHKMKRGFEAGATFFKGRVHFLEVQCSASEASKSFCAEHAVTRYPTLKLFTGEQVIPFQGSRAVAAYELFFHDNKDSFPESPLGVVPAFNVDQLQLSSAEASLVGHGYPIREEDVGVPDTSLPVITDEINAARSAVARDDAEEAMADATVDAAGGTRTAPRKQAAATPAPSAAPAADAGGLTQEFMAAVLSELRGVRSDVATLGKRVEALEEK